EQSDGPNGTSPSIPLVSAGVEGVEVVQSTFPFSREPLASAHPALARGSRLNVEVIAGQPLRTGYRGSRVLPGRAAAADSGGRGRSSRATGRSPGRAWPRRPADRSAGQRAEPRAG